MEHKHKIKILFTIGFFGTGGKERQLAELIKRLPKNKYELYLFAKSYKTHYLDHFEKYLVNYLFLNKKKFSLTDVIKFSQYAKKIQPDVIFSFSFFTSYLALLSKVINRGKYKIINGAIRDAHIKIRGVKKIHKILLNFFKYVTANSLAGLYSYHQNGKKYRFVLPNGFDFSRLPNITKETARKEFKIPHNEYVVAMIGRLNNFKDQETVIRAAEILKTRNPEIHFYFVGEGPKRTYLENLSRGLPIYFLGEINQVETFLTAADLCLLISTPNYGEGFPNAILEALAAGCPVIASDNPGTREIIENKHTGFIIENKNPKMLSDKVLEIKNNKSLAENFSKAGYSLVKQKYDFPLVINIFEQMIETVLAN